VSPDEKRRRNVAIAAYVGSFALPLAGLVGAAFVNNSGDRSLARGVLISALLGTVFWVLVLTR
jgi:hypothetical protein